MTKDSAAEATEIEESSHVDVEPTEAEPTKAESAEAESTEAEPTKDEPTDADQPRGGRFAALAPVRAHLGMSLLVVAMIASLATAAALYFLQYKPEQKTNAAATAVAVDAAKNGAVALLSYSPDTLDKDFANAKSHLTGDFLDYYSNFTQQIVTPAAREKQVKTTATVVQAAAADMQPDSATVLLFINQSTVSKENPDGAFAASAVKVGMKNVNGSWLISAFDPV